MQVLLAASSFVGPKHMLVVSRGGRSLDAQLAQLHGIWLSAGNGMVRSAKDKSYGLRSTCKRRSWRASRWGFRDLSPSEAMSCLRGDSFATARTLRLLAAPPGQFSSNLSRLQPQPLLSEIDAYPHAS